ncbi:MAG: dihydroneopterin aldolase [Ignavibacteriae bacterium HGW-Ignavibacteriae-2]|jgi:dihydroneopterin aldolase|nr:dihydroneopterin aldolase [Bacteroidota bacterium]PKL88259.1 MAG: dihydroneopterin aldolase [Ignavibacteriae bacterium HGW-Ignavibacteriae-2]
MKNTIRIKNATFYAYHGALQEEQIIGGKFEVDIDMETDFSKAAYSDDLSHTINYDHVYKFIGKLVFSKKYYLIETLSMIIADELLQKFPVIKKIIVKVRKRSVPIGGVIDFVEAEVEKSNAE